MTPNPSLKLSPNGVRHAAGASLARTLDASSRTMSDAPSVYDLARCAMVDREAAQALLQARPDLINAKDSTGETALHYLVVENYLDGVSFLVGHGADVNTQDNFGRTPLMHAAQLNYVSICRFLIGQGARVNVRDIEDETALFRASAAGAIVILDLLIESGADVHTRNSLDESIIDDALPEKRAEVLRLLKKHGYDAAHI